MERQGSRYKSLLIFLVALHFFGIIGISLPWTRDLFTMLTPLNLVLSAGILLIFHHEWNTKTIVYLAFVFILTFFIEVAGVHTGQIFGEYAYGSTLGYKVFSVPVLIGLNWVMLIYSTGMMGAKLFKKNTFIAALFGASLMVLLDVFIEQLAENLGLWAWEKSIIPAKNYIAWFIISFVLLAGFIKFVVRRYNPMSINLYFCQLIFFVMLLILKNFFFFLLVRVQKIDNKLGQYSIKDLEQFSGIKAHTIRIWEQRYSFFNPGRTASNIRYYSDADLRLILNISLLQKKGYKISKLAAMSAAAISSEVMKLTGQEENFPAQLHSLTVAMLEINEAKFEKILNTSIIHHGFEATMKNMVYPFLERIGFLWQTGAINTSHEHFITNLIRQKIIVAIDGQIPAAEAKKFLLFLPEGELHEISLLFSCYLLRSRNYHVIYLGQSLPYEDLKTAYKTHNPEYLFSVFTTYPLPDQVEEYVNNLSSDFPEAKVILSGSLMFGHNFELRSNCITIQSPEELTNLLSSIS